MDRNVAGLIGAMGALAAVGQAHATAAPAMTPQTVLQAESYADLLKPIPNALAIRQALAESQPAVEAGQPEVMTVQYYHHHHHHHHRYYRRRFYHHHHYHHHHHGVRIGPVVIR